MDKVGAVLEEISRLPELARLEAKSGKFLNELAEIYERHGPGTTRAYLLNRKGRDTNLFLKIFDRLDKCPDVRANRAIGRQILKCLFELKNWKGAG
jgi:hypothetical protein